MAVLEMHRQRKHTNANLHRLRKRLAKNVYNHNDAIRYLDEMLADTFPDTLVSSALDQAKRELVLHRAGLDPMSDDAWMWVEACKFDKKPCSGKDCYYALDAERLCNFSGFFRSVFENDPDYHFCDHCWREKNFNYAIISKYAKAAKKHYLECKSIRPYMKGVVIAPILSASES